MIIEVVPISSLTFKKVHYYSVQVGGNDITEFQDFIQRMSINPDNHLELDEINKYIEVIGEKKGAFPGQFRNEDAAEGLPPPYHQFVHGGEIDDFGLRLYCIRLSVSVVILLNGDRKTAQKVNDCENCRPHFNFARALAKKITQAIVDDNIEIDEDNKELLIAEDFELQL